LLFMDVEVVKGLDHLLFLERNYTPAKIKKLLQKIELEGSMLITTSSSYSLTKKAKYHVYIIVDGNVEIETFKKKLLMLSEKIGALVIDKNNRTQSSFCDLSVYQPSRVIYEAQALNLDGGKIYKKKFCIS